jgi:hypothetical protein
MDDFRCESSVMHSILSSVSLSSFEELSHQSSLTNAIASAACVKLQRSWYAFLSACIDSRKPRNNLELFAICF